MGRAKPAPSKILTYLGLSMFERVIHAGERDCSSSARAWKLPDSF
jgi:hypothetical protein